MACGDITDIEFTNNRFVINVEENMILTLLQEGKKEIEKALRWQGIDCEVIINLKKVELSEEEQDILKLKNVFGDFLVIENKK